MKKTNIAIGRRMRSMRLSNKETAKDLAKLLCCTPSTVNKYERGELPIDSAKINLICKHYKINHRWLFVGQGVKITSKEEEIELTPDIFEFYTQLNSKSKTDLVRFLKHILMLIK